MSAQCFLSAEGKDLKAKVDRASMSAGVFIYFTMM